VERQHLRRQHLQLQRNWEPVLWSPRSETEEYLPGDEHLARGAALQAVEIGKPLCVGVVRPIQPEFLHLRLQRRLRDHRGRLDAGADHIAGPALDRVGRIAVVAYQPARAGRNIGTGRRDQRVEVRPARLKPAQPPVDKPGLETADKRTDAPADIRQQSQHRITAPWKLMSECDAGGRRCQLLRFGVQDR
jgi:hypothetical protein